MSKLDDSIYRFLWSFLVCVVLGSLIVVIFFLGADYLEAEVYNGELPEWVRFLALIIFGFLIVCLVLMTVGRAGDKVKAEYEKETIARERQAGNADKSNGE